MIFAICFIEMTNSVVKVLNHLYEHVNVYHTVIVTESYSETPLLLQVLDEHDFTVHSVTEDDFNCIKDIEKRYRVFIVHQGDFEGYVQAKGWSLNDITLIVTTTKNAYDSVHDYISGHSCLKDPLYLICAT